MPAVSTSVNVPAGVFHSVSMASMVVPARGSTRTRSSRSSMFTIEDLPTLGRPTMATRVPGAGGSLARLGRSATTSSSRSPMPKPFSEETGSGSPSPRRSAVSAVWLTSSTLLTTRRLFAWRRRRSRAIATSRSVTPVLTSTMKSTASANSMAISAWRRTRASRPSAAPGRKPPVSTSRKV